MVLDPGLIELFKPLAWGSQIVLIGGVVLLGFIKGLPAIKRAFADENAAIFREWEKLKKDVEEDLAECKQARLKDAERMTRIEAENRRLRTAVSIMLTELHKLDPSSEAIKHAHAVLAAAVMFENAVPSLRKLAEKIEELNGDEH